MNETQRAAAERLADDLQRFDGAERESLRDEAAALLRELLAEPVINQQMTTELAEPVQEPVGWLNEIDGEFEHSHKPWMDNPTEEWHPVYAAPQQRKPLSADQIRDAVNDHAFWATSKNFIFRIARAIERAHGITGEPT